MAVSMASIRSQRSTFIRSSRKVHGKVYCMILKPQLLGIRANEECSCRSTRGKYWFGPLETCRTLRLESISSKRVKEYRAPYHCGVSQDMVPGSHRFKRF